MPFQTRYFFIASMDVDADKEALFHEVYDTEHIPEIMKVAGVISAVRSSKEELSMSMGGQIQKMDYPNEPKFHAIYEIESPDVLVSEAWAAAVEMGRWPSQVRPYTRNRRHVLHKIMTPIT